jgi:hypothetical protein
MSGLDLIGLARATEEEARQADKAEMGNNFIDWLVNIAVVLAIVSLIAGMTSCASTAKKYEAELREWAIENIPEAERLLNSTTEGDSERKTGVQVVKWAKGQDRGYISVEIWNLMPPVENNSVGPEYYLMYSRGPDIRRGDTMTMARRGRRDEIRHYYTCNDPAYGKKVCASVGSTYPNAWTRLEWEWKPGSMDFRVNGNSAKRSPVKNYAGKIKALWMPGCPHAGRVYPCEWRGLVIRTVDKPKSGGAEHWEQL